VNIAAAELERIDLWVLKVSIAIPVVCLAALLLWHLAAFLARKLFKKPRTPLRESPEPPERPARAEALPNISATDPSVGDNPERLQQACAALEDLLADRYIELAESWLRRGQPQQATAAFKRVLQICPGSQQAKLAQDRLQQVREG
jgi:hypothetical protein